MSKPVGEDPKEPVIGIPWYNKRTWLRMKEICEDTENFHTSYQLWLASADKSIVLCTNRGQTFKRLNIDPTSYAWWCENNAFKRDKKSRRAYVRYLLKIDQN